MTFFDDPADELENPFAPARTKITPETFTIPDSLPRGGPSFGNPLPSFLPGIGSSRRPSVISRLPESLTAFENKYEEYADVFRQQLSPATYQALVDFDWNRAQRGQTPLSAAQTQRAVSAVEHQTPFTPPPVKKPGNVLGNIVSDVGAIAKSLPALPAALISEVGRIPSFGKEYKEQVELGANPITASLRSPGLRLLPGAYTVGNIAAGKSGIAEGATHPIFTALDILPFGKTVGAGKAVGRLPVPGRAANLSELSAATKAGLGRTAPGQFLTAAFGKDSRLSARIFNQAERKITEWANINGRIASPDDIVTTARQATSWADRHGIIDEAEFTLLYDIATSGDANLFAKLSPERRAAIDDLRDIVDVTAEQRATLGDGVFLQTRKLRDDGTDFDEIGQPEFYINVEAQPIIRNRAKVSIQRMGNAVRELIKPSDVKTVEPHIVTRGARKGQETTKTVSTPVEQTLDDVTTFWPELKKYAETDTTGLASFSPRFVQQRLNPARLEALKGYIYAMESKGIDVADLLSDKGALSKAIVGDAKTPFSTQQQINNLVREIDSRVSGTARMTELGISPTDRLYPFRDPQSVLEAVKPYTSSPPFSKKFIVLEDAVRRWKKDPLDESNFKRAIDTATELRRTATNPLEDSVVDTILQSLRANRNRATYVNKLDSKYSTARLTRIQKALDRVESRTPPARFAEVLEQQSREGIKQAYIEKFGNDANWPEIERVLNDEMYPGLSKFDPESGQLISKVVRDTNQTWRELKASGVDPIFIHRTSPTQAMGINFQKLYDYIPTLSQLKKRAFDPTNAEPYIKDIQVGLNHQHLEILRRRAMEDAVTQMLDMPFVKTADQAFDQYYALAERHRDVTSGKISVRDKASELIKRDLTEWDPNSIITWKAPTLAFQQIDGPPVYYIPKAIKSNFDRMGKAPALKGVFDPVMNAFRTSILPLSPRWHAYNILGGYMMLSMETNPLVAFKYIKSARELMKTGKTTVKGRSIDISDELRYMQGGERDVFRTAQLQAGRSMSRWFYESLERRNHPMVGGAVRKAGEVGKRIVEKSFDFNQFFDDTYRAMAYIYGYDKALTKGMAPEAVMSNAMSTVRKVMHSLDSLTPIERSIFRSVFPFYGFMSHIVRFAMRFPYDHPFRVAVISSFAQNELTDLGSGLPEKMLGLIPLGGIDDKGTERFLNLTGANPFTDVADLLTLQGWVGAVNPILSTGLQQIGLDPATASPELYPDVTYDAESGRLVYKASNPIMSLLSNTIPQTRFLQALVGGSSEFNELARENPDAAQRLLMSNVGIPLMWRDINIPQERIKVQMAIEKGEQEAKTAALKSGDWDEALRYPSLRPLFDQVSELSSEQLMPYSPARLEAAQSEILETIK